MRERTIGALRSSIVLGRRWRLATLIARRAIGRASKRYAVAILIIALPVVLIIVSTTLWLVSSSPRFLASRWLGADNATQAIALRVSRSPIWQDPLGQEIETREGEGVEDDEVDSLLRSWTPAGDEIEIVESIESASLTRIGAAKSTSVEGAVQTSSLSAPQIGVPGLSGDLDAGHAVLTEDLASELGASVGSALVVSTSANAGADSSSQKATVVVDALFAGDRRVVIGAGTIPLATEAVGEGSSTSYFIVGTTPIPWEKVESLNASGFLVVSRAVLASPPEETNAAPAASARADAWRPFVIGVGAALVLIELVLLVTPIFAVAQNRAMRSAAALFAVGGDHHDQGRMMLALGWIVGLRSSAVAFVLVAIANLRLSLVFGLGAAFVPWQSLLLAALLPCLLSLVASIAPARDLASIDSVAVIGGKARTPSRLVRRIPGYPVAFLLALPILAGAAFAGSLPLLAVGLVLLEAGLIGSIPYTISRKWRYRDTASIGVRLALRDAIRNGHRTLPAMASLMTTAFIAAALLITLTSTNEAAWRAEAHVGPRGSVLVMDADPSDSTVQARAKQNAAASAVSDSRPVVDSASLNGMPWNSGGNGPTLLVEAVSPNGGESLSIADRSPSLAELDLAYIVDDGSYLAVSGLVSDDAMVRAVTTLSAGGAILPDSSYIGEDGTARLRALDMTDSLAAAANGLDDAPAPVVASEASVKASSWDALDVIVLSPRAAQSLSLPAKPVGQLLVLDDPVSPFSAASLSTSIAKAVPGTTTTVVQPRVRDFLIPHIAALIALVAAAGTVALVVVLSGTDLESDFETLEAMGAPSDLRARVSAYQGIGLALACVPVSVLSGLFAGVIAVLTLARSGMFSGLVTLSPAIPWFELGVLLFGAPLLAMLVARIFSPRGRAHRRRAG